jgi:hypothetical protein
MGMKAGKILGSWLALALITVAAQAADPVDFSGTWILNTDKGQNLGMVSAIQETLVVTQTDTNLDQAFTDVFNGNTTTRSVSYDLAGGAVTNYAAMGEQSETVSTWDGVRLVTTWTSEGAIAGTTVVKTETRWLSDDGKSMSVESSRGDRPSMIMVYDRQE